MFVLPENIEDIQTPAFWDDFFKNGRDTFEWYGEPEGLRPYYRRYIQVNSRVLVVGCGNSKLSQVLHEKDKVVNVLSIDRSSTVIDQMRKQNKAHGLKFVQMDIRLLSFDPDSFDVVFDKATLDTICANDTLSKEAVTYLEQVDRVLSSLGRFICVTLAQPNVLKSILDFFLERPYMLKVYLVHRTNKKPEKFPVFVFIWVKLKKVTSSPVQKFELITDRDKSLRFSDAKCFSDHMQYLQNSFRYASEIRSRFRPDEELEVTVTSTGSRDEKPLFIFHIVDSADTDHKNLCSVLIIPVGREVEWLYQTREGRKQLLEMTSSKRLLVTFMGQDKSFKDLVSLKIELEHHVSQFLPDCATENYQIPIMSIGDDVGERLIRKRYTGNVVGPFFVEDVRVSQDWYRRLMFERSLYATQSEVALMHTQAEDGFVVNLSQLNNDYSGVSLALIVSLHLSGLTGKFLMAGLGGGVLATQIHLALESAIKLTLIEIDEKIVDAAREWFSWSEKDFDDTLVVDDGRKYIERLTADKANHGQFSMMVFDAESEEAASDKCKLATFLTDVHLSCAKKLLGAHPAGILLVNFLTRMPSVRLNAISSLKSVFGHVYSILAKEDINELFLCSSDPIHLQSILTNNEMMLKTLRCKFNCVDQFSDYLTEELSFVEH